MTAAEPAYAAAYQGTPGAYSEEAAWTLVGADASLLPCPSLADVFDAVAGGHARRAVVPVENSLAGTVPRTYELLLDGRLRAVGEARVHIDHVLIGPRAMRVADVRRVLSHPVALDQCTRFIAEHGLQPVAVFDTAGAVDMVLAENRGDAAAIASRRAAQNHDARILAEHIQDHRENWTRFLMLEKTGAIPESAGGKAIVAFRLPHAPGTLARALGHLASRGLNLTRIESRPIEGQPFEYAFVIELTCGDQSPAWTRWLDEFRAIAQEVRLLGAF